jgi:serine/threonine protein kinase
VTVNKTQFQFLCMIGKGGFSRVWRVERKKDRVLLALKEMSKARILAKRSVHSILNERNTLVQLHHPYQSQL